MPSRTAGTRRRLRAVAGGAALLVGCCWSVPGRAQGAATASSPGLRPFVGGGILIWTITGARRGPADIGPDGLTPSESPVFDWPVVGGVVNGGVFFTRRVSVSGEVSFRLAQSATISERTQAHLETWELSSRYTDSEWLTSILLGYR